MAVPFCATTPPAVPVANINASLVPPPLTTIDDTSEHSGDIYYDDTEFKKGGLHVTTIIRSLINIQMIKTYYIQKYMLYSPLK